ncbi:hypothetical protein BSKO_08823 [Bryopsis sp. KO-2023]|nr:hypothetical protein BSKO_08823 [Bryopsis sp. KO-2023]
MALCGKILKAAGLAYQPAVRATFGQSSRWMSVSGIGNLPEKERGEERLYFNKEDEKLLKKLLSKVKGQADKNDKHGAEGTKAAELSALKDILGKYKVSDDDMVAVLEWKNTHY